MVISIRIYRQHDMDLVTLACDKDFGLGREMKRVLLSAANETPLAPKEIPDISFTEGYVPRLIRVQFSLSPKKPEEAKAFQLLSKVKRGYRCSFLKALFRNQYMTLPLSEYLITSGFVLKKEQRSMIQDNETNNSVPEKKKEELNQTEQIPVDVPKPTFQKPVNVPATEPNKAEDLDAMFEKLNALG